jgi:protein-disulfide isomerase
LLAAAEKQGKFWETLEAVFAAQADWAPQHQPRPELVWNAIGNVGLDIAKVRHDMELPEIANMIQQDMADAKTLKVKATPEFFVNGKPLPTWGYDQLKTLVEDEVKAAY